METHMIQYGMLTVLRDVLALYIVTVGLVNTMG